LTIVSKETYTVSFQRPTRSLFCVKSLFSVSKETYTVSFLCQKRPTRSLFCVKRDLHGLFSVSKETYTVSFLCQKRPTRFLFRRDLVRLISVSTPISLFFPYRYRSRYGEVYLFSRQAAARSVVAMFCQQKIKFQKKNLKSQVP